MDIPWVLARLEGAQIGAEGKSVYLTIPTSRIASISLEAVSPFSGPVNAAERNISCGVTVCPPYQQWLFPSHGISDFGFSMMLPWQAGVLMD